MLTHTFHLTVLADIRWFVGAFSSRMTLLVADTARALENTGLRAFGLRMTGTAFQNRYNEQQLDYPLTLPRRS